MIELPPILRDSHPADNSYFDSQQEFLENLGQDRSADPSYRTLSSFTFSPPPPQPTSASTNSAADLPNPPPYYVHSASYHRVELTPVHSERRLDNDSLGSVLRRLGCAYSGWLKDYSCFLWKLTLNHKTYSIHLVPRKGCKAPQLRLMHPSRELIDHLASEIFLSSYMVVSDLEPSFSLVPVNPEDLHSLNTFISRFSTLKHPGVQFKLPNETGFKTHYNLNPRKTKSKATKNYIPENSQEIHFCITLKSRYLRSKGVKFLGDLLTFRPLDSIESLEFRSFDREAFSKYLESLSRTSSSLSKKQMNRNLYKERLGSQGVRNFLLAYLDESLLENGILFTIATLKSILKAILSKPVGWVPTSQNLLDIELNAGKRNPKYRGLPVPSLRRYFRELPFEAEFRDRVATIDSFFEGPQPQPSPPPKPSHMRLRSPIPVQIKPPDGSYTSQFCLPSYTEGTKIQDPRERGPTDSRAPP